MLHSNFHRWHRGFPVPCPPRWSPSGRNDVGQHGLPMGSHGRTGKARRGYMGDSFMTGEWCLMMVSDWLIIWLTFFICQWLLTNGWLVGIVHGGSTINQMTASDKVNQSQWRFMTKCMVNGGYNHRWGSWLSFLELMMVDRWSVMMNS